MNIMFITNPWRLSIKDKIIISKKKCYPKHRFPHKIPFITKPVINEPCHFHKRKWRMAHHIFYCRLINCPYYQFMTKDYNKWKNKKENV